MAEIMQIMEYFHKERLTEFYINVKYFKVIDISRCNLKDHLKIWVSP